jgi:hypothetical protein
MDDRQAQIAEELRRILPIIEELTGLASHWNGTVLLVPGANFKGKKRFSCGMEIDAAIAAEDTRWSTLIHEVLHSVSAGYNRDDYQAFRGWEEGTVEQLQRLFRPHVLARLAVPVTTMRFADLDRYHRYNDYIEALEAIREALGGDTTPPDQIGFYRDLLATPIRNRPGHLLGLAYKQPGPLRFEFVKTFSSANATLIGRLL